MFFIMKMNLSKRNKQNALARWQKIRKKEIDFINSNFDKKHFKARILGCIAGDGSISFKNGRSDIRFYPDHISLLKVFSSAMKEYYNKDPNVKNLSKHYLARIFSKTICDDLLSECSLGTYNWTFPFNICKDFECKKEWLKAFFDCESYVGKNRISLGSVNSIGLNQVKEQLLYFGINSKIYEYQPKNKKWSKTFILVISGRQSLCNYSLHIGFNHQVKSEKLKTLIFTKDLSRDRITRQCADSMNLEA